MDCLTSRRLRLRQLAPADADCLAQLVADASALQWAPVHDQPFDSQSARRYILSTMAASRSGRSFALTIEHLAERRVMGELQLDALRGAVGYWLAPQYRGLGYTIEALQTLAPWARQCLKMDALVADVARENLASRRVLEMAGFRFKFIHRNAGTLHASARSTLLRYQATLPQR